MCKVYKQYVGGGIKLYVRLKNVDIGKYGDYVTARVHFGWRGGVSKKSTLCTLM